MTSFRQYLIEKEEFRIGVIGYIGDFDIAKAQKLIEKGFNKLSKDKTNISVVSGLTDIGIMGLAYKEASKRGWKTEGIACKKAFNFSCYPVDNKKIVGDKWGDESETFLNSIDVLLRIGGGKQSIAETEAAKKKGIPVLYYKLEQIKNG